MGEQEQPRLTTQAAHKRRVQEFVNLHGNLPLVSVTKRHVIEFVDHLDTMTHRGRSLAATTKSGYLDSVAALFNFACSQGLIPFNPAHNVKRPKDHRPKIAQSWQSLDKGEMQALVSFATELWTNRRALKYLTNLTLLRGNLT